MTEYHYTFSFSGKIFADDYQTGADEVNKKFNRIFEQAKLKAETDLPCTVQKASLDFRIPDRPKIDY